MVCEEVKMKAQILKMLREADGYISGQQLCEKFGVSRTAVWKVIRQLQEEGYEVEAVRNKGYRIIDSPDVMTKEELESLMDTKWAGKNIVYYDEVDSTNLRIKQLGDEGAVEGTLAVADRQTAGRGRRGRSWDSPAGESISMSILLRPQITPNQAPMLTLVMACSVAEGIMDCKDVCGEQQIQIKWPNDIIIHGKKLVGILTEMSTQIDYINHVTVGVGINVNLTDFPEEIRERATSLRLECGHKVKRAPLIAAIMKRLEENYALFMETGDLSQLMEKYSELLVNKDRDVMIHSREAAADTMEIMKKYGKDLNGVIHCYSYSPEMAQEYVKMGYFIGVGGVVTFKNAKKLKETVKEIPLESIVLETDCPYLAPEPFRGKRNCSLYISYVAEKIAELKGISAEEVIRQTEENAKQLYQINESRLLKEQVIE